MVTVYCNAWPLSTRELMVSRSPADESNVHVWVGGISSSAGEDEVMKALTEANVPPPNGVLRVAGCTPGLLLQFAMADSVLLAVDALRLTKAERPSSHLLAGTHVQDAGRTLWVGQVTWILLTCVIVECACIQLDVHGTRLHQIGPVVREEDVLNAFSRFGELRGWKFLRQSHCAFIDFVSTPAAEEAKHILDGARFSGCNIRVELKASQNIHVSLDDNEFSVFRFACLGSAWYPPEQVRASFCWCRMTKVVRSCHMNESKRRESQVRGPSAAGHHGQLCYLFGCH